MKGHLVLNHAKSEGFFTIDQQVAYEVRKGADSNCFSAEGERSQVGQAFCERWSWHEDCTKTQVLAVDDQALTVLNEIRNRTRRGIKQSKTIIDRTRAKVNPDPYLNQKRLDHLARVEEIYSYQLLVLATLERILPQEV